jgi:hypothetical protein
MRLRLRLWLLRRGWLGALLLRFLRTLKLLQLNTLSLRALLFHLLGTLGLLPRAQGLFLLCTLRLLLISLLGPLLLGLLSDASLLFLLLLGLVLLLRPLLGLVLLLRPLLGLVLLLRPLLRLQLLGLLPGPLLLFLQRPLLPLVLLLRPLLRLQLFGLLPGALLLFLLGPLLRLVLLLRPLLRLQLLGVLPGALLLFLLGPLLRLVQRALGLRLRRRKRLRQRRRCAGRLHVLGGRRPSAKVRSGAAALRPRRAIAAVERHKDPVTRRRGKSGGPRQQQAQGSGLEDLPSHGAPLALKSAGSPGAGAATQPLDREHRMAMRWTTRERASGPAA